MDAGKCYPLVCFTENVDGGSFVGIGTFLPVVQVCSEVF